MAETATPWSTGARSLMADLGVINGLLADPESVLNKIPPPAAETSPRTEGYTFILCPDGSYVCQWVYTFSAGEPDWIISFPDVLTPE